MSAEPIHPRPPTPAGEPRRRAGNLALRLLTAALLIPPIVSEVWLSQTSHQESLSLPSVQKAITLGKPLIAGFGERFETTPIGGHGLSDDSLA